MVLGIRVFRFGTLSHLVAVNWAATTVIFVNESIGFMLTIDTTVAPLQLVVLVFEGKIHTSPSGSRGRHLSCQLSPAVNAILVTDK